MADPMLAAFVAESRENLETAGRCFLELEQRPGERSLLDDLFRAVHTIKGSSGLFDVLPLTQVVHAAEDVLDRVRDGVLALGPGDVDVFLEAVDQVGLWLDALEANGVLPGDAPEIGVRLAVTLRARLPKDAGPAAGDVAEPGPGTWTPDLPGDALAALRDVEPAPEAGLVVRYRPGEDCFFSGDDPLHTVRGAPGLLWFAVAPRSAWPEPDALDPFVCNLEFIALCGAQRAEVLDHFRYVIDQVAVAPVPVPAPAPREGSGTPAPVSRASAEDRALALDLVAAQLRLLRAGPDDDGALAAGRLAAARTALARLEGTGILEAREGPLEDGVTAGELVARLERHGAALRSAADVSGVVVPLPARRRDRDEAPGGVDRDGGVAPVAAPGPGPGSAMAVAAPADAAAPGPGPRAGRVLRVEAERVDALMDLVGELVVEKNAMPFLARRAEETYGVRPLAREIKARHAQLERLTEALQQAMMQVRMVPVGSQFQRFPRLVRDLARKLGKTVHLELEGEETEADKYVVESLADPLIHLVRNSLDHGLETPEDRVAAGKAPEGSLRLRAEALDDQILIEIADDGRGIDPARVRRRAYERGLLDEERLEALTDQEAQELVLMPGFSTAETVSDLSGRGVGMDAVRAAVVRAGGRVGLESEVGRGTIVRLTLPLSMAVSRVLAVEVAGQTYGVGMKSIVETVRLPRERLRRVRSGEAVVLRDRLVPVRHLRALLGLPEGEPEGEVAILVLSVAGHEVGLVVDALREAMDLMVKPLEGIMASCRAYAGSAVLGSGRVLLVLDLPELLACP